MKAIKLAIAILLALLVGAPQASAALQPLNLRVDGGEESWSAERSFAVRWDNPPGAVAAVHYRLLNSSGQVALAETTLAWPATAIQHLTVPPIPDTYSAEVWLEDTEGNEGVPGSVQLRFDDSAPGPVGPLSPAGWIGRTAFPYTLHLGRPTDPEPLSGIRGYAVSLGAAPGIAPCAGIYTCNEAETDLRGGIAADALTIAALPEGTSYLRAVAVSGSGMRSSAAAETILKVDKTDPVTRLTGLSEGWSNLPLTLKAEATDAASGMAAGGAFTAIRIDGGAPAVAAGGTVSAPVIDSGIHTVAYYARDAVGNVADGGFANGWPNQAPPTAMVRIDRDAPHLSFTGAQDPREPERIEARAADSLSGLDRSRASIAVRRAGASERFERLLTELSAETLQAHWDSEAYPPGEYEFRATVYDLAGNSVSTVSRGNGSPMRLHNPLKVGMTLSASLGRPTVPYGRGMSFSGQLIAGRRTALGGMPVQVIERFEAGAEPVQRVSTVRTGADGEFSVRLRPGPSREIVAVASPTATLRSARSKPARLTVRSGVRMAVSSPVAKVGGRPIVFHGRVGAAGAAIPADGKIVQLQFRLPGLPWSGFRSVRTDAQGRFRYAYRFADDDSRGARFQFRAFAPAQAGWPYQPASSTPVQVRGL
jgi:hypothetical protein